MFPLMVGGGCIAGQALPSLVVSIFLGHKVMTRGIGAMTRGTKANTWGTKEKTRGIVASFYSMAQYQVRSCVGIHHLRLLL